MPYARPRTPTVVATREDFLNTYQDGLENAVAYDTAIGLAKRGVSPTKIVAQVGKSKYTVKDWTHHGTKPHSVLGLEQAMDLGLLVAREEGVSFRADDERFLYVNRLAAGVFWSGSFSTKYPTGTNLNMSGQKDRLEHLQRYFESKIPGLKATVVKHSQQDGYQLVVANGGAVVARLFDAMGLPHAGEQKQLPAYIKRITERKPSPRSREMRALRDFAHPLFTDRLTEAAHQCMCVEVYLHKTDTQEHARRYASEVLGLLHVVLPTVLLGEHDVTFQLVHDDGVRPCITLRKKTVEAIIAQPFPYLRITRPEPVW